MINYYINCGNDVSTLSISSKLDANLLFSALIVIGRSSCARFQPSETVEILYNEIKLVSCKNGKIPCHSK